MHVLSPARAFVVAALAAVLTASGAGTASAADSCRVIEIDMVPTADLQIVVWLEDSEGNYVDTLFITRLTGSYGLGNRPGIMEFDSAWMWPYGRRTTTFPVWAQRHPYEFGLVIFQNSTEIGDTSDQNLSHPAGQSSVEDFYCKPLIDGEQMWDTMTCSSIVATDKGMYHPTAKSKYPPRSDLGKVAGVDHDDVDKFATDNVFDAVSRATPPGGSDFTVTWPIPPGMADGNYVAYVEVNREWDQNDNYSYTEPVGIPWANYGLPYRGQPSIVYRAEFTLADGEMTAYSPSYYGYGDPDGVDGNVRPPDATITTGVSGSGASRLMLTQDETQQYRMRVRTRPTFDTEAPGSVSSLEAVDVTSSSITARFIAPGDDGDIGMVTSYEVRYMAGKEMTEANFSEGTLLGTQLSPRPAGEMQTFTINGLLGRTNYYIGVRAFDECMSASELTILKVVTPTPEGGEVDACFVATAAYGSLMANEVKSLRGFRDSFLRSHAPGELLVETYYTFGPALAKMIGPSETARRAARAALGPLVDVARDLMRRHPSRSPAAAPVEKR
jgi:hypothetical protein